MSYLATLFVVKPDHHDMQHRSLVFVPAVRLHVFPAVLLAGNSGFGRPTPTRSTRKSCFLAAAGVDGSAAAFTRSSPVHHFRFVNPSPPRVRGMVAYHARGCATKLFRVSRCAAAPRKAMTVEQEHRSFESVLHCHRRTSRRRFSTASCER